MSPRHHVLIVGHDRVVLGQLSRLLREFGYTTRVAAEVRAAELAASLQPPDLLIAEAAELGPDGLARCQAASRHEDGTPVYTFVLTDAHDPRELKKAVEKGADDFLLRPLVWGEVLARTRAASRVLELERRLREISGVDRLTGLPTRSRFVGLVDELLEKQQVSVVVIDVERTPTAATRQALSETAEALAELAGRGIKAARIGRARFAIARPDESEDKAAAWAERARLALLNHVGDKRRRQDDALLSVSAGVASGKFPALELLSQAEAACDEAQASGGNVVFRYAQAREAQKCWRELRLPGRLFERTTARDLMLPNVVALQEDDAVATARLWLERMQRDGLAVVDGQGRLLGWVRGESLDGAADEATVGELADPEVPICEESTSFPRLMELFTSDGRGEMIVTRDRKPVGVLTRSGLAALIEPDDRMAYASDVVDPGTRDLLISDTVAT